MQSGQKQKDVKKSVKLLGMKSETSGVFGKQKGVSRAMFLATNSLIFFTIFGRGDRIRTCDPLHPMLGILAVFSRDRAALFETMSKKVSKVLILPLPHG